MTKAVLFDLDGTLLDTGPDLHAAINRLLRQKNLPLVDYAEIKPKITLGGRAMLRQAFGDLSDQKLDKLYKQFVDLYKRSNFTLTKPFPGIAELIAKLEEDKLPWGIVTNKPGWLTEPIVAIMKCLRNAKCVVSGDTTPAAKPSPEPLLYACNKIAIAPSQCLYVGDAITDIEAGKNAGTATMAVTFGYSGNRDNVPNWGADNIAHDALDIYKWVKEWCQQP